MCCASGGRRPPPSSGGKGVAGCHRSGAIIQGFMHLALRALLGIALPADGREHEGLGRLLGLEVVHVEQVRQRAHANVLGLRQRIGRRRVGERHEVAEHGLHRGDVDLLADNAVLDQPVLGCLPLLRLHTDSEEPQDDSLNRRLPRAVPLGRKHVVKRHQRVVLPAHGYQLIRAPQRILGLRKVHHGERPLRPRQPAFHATGAGSKKGSVRVGPTSGVRLSRAGAWVVRWKRSAFGARLLASTRTGAADLRHSHCSGR